MEAPRLVHSESLCAYSLSVGSTVKLVSAESRLLETSFPLAYKHMLTATLAQFSYSLR